MSGMELTARKREILRRVVEEYVATGQPVGSRYLVERSGMTVSSSTVRYELAELEQRGLLDRLEPRPAQFPLDLSAMRNEVESALQSATEMLSQVTHLLALVSAPP